MNKTDGLENLAKALAGLPEALKETQAPNADGAVILARVVNGVAGADLARASHAGQLAGWLALPLPPGETLEELETATGEYVAISPFREAQGILTRGSFALMLKEELARLARNGGCLSLVAAGLADREMLARTAGQKAAERLEAMLGAIILNHLESCDSAGFLRRGQFICCLPGMGQLAARSFSEKTQREFQEEASACYPDLPRNALPACAIGIINLLQGENGTARELVRRVKLALEMALNKKSPNIYQETSMAPLENTTLVHSSEKRFLFFGGAAS